MNLDIVMLVFVGIDILLSIKDVATTEGKERSAHFHTLVAWGCCLLWVLIAMKRLAP